jgi:uncharacterized protein (TIGR03000 family)
MMKKFSWSTFAGASLGVITFALSAPGSVSAQMWGSNGGSSGGSSHGSLFSGHGSNGGGSHGSLFAGHGSSGGSKHGSLFAGHGSSGGSSHGSLFAGHGSNGGSKHGSLFAGHGSSGGSSHGSLFAGHGSSGGSKHGSVFQGHGSSGGGSHGSLFKGHGSTGGSYGSTGGTYGSTGGSYGSAGGYFMGSNVAAPSVANNLLASNMTVAPVNTGVGYLNVNVPADAKVYLQDQLMTVGGTQRRFVTPQMENGVPHVYTVKVELVRNGQTISKTTQAAVAAGQEVGVSVAFDAQNQQELVATTALLASL